MTESEKRAVRKVWGEKNKKHRNRLNMQSRINSLTPPASDNEVEPQRPQNNVFLGAKRRSDCQRKLRKRIEHY